MAKELNELFRVVTSMNIDVEDMIKNTTNKEETFRHLIWHIPNGVKWKNNPEMSANVKELMNTLSEKCGVNAEEIYNEDGKLDYREELALSSATVEVVPPVITTEEPSEEPVTTEAPTDAPTDTPTEDKETVDETPSEEPTEEA